MDSVDLKRMAALTSSLRGKVVLARNLSDRDRALISQSENRYHQMPQYQFDPLDRDLEEETRPTSREMRFQ